MTPFCGRQPTILLYPLAVKDGERGLTGATHPHGGPLPMTKELSTIRECLAYGRAVWRVDSWPTGAGFLQRWIRPYG